MLRNPRKFSSIIGFENQITKDSIIGNSPIKFICFNEIY